MSDNAKIIPLDDKPEDIRSEALESFLGYHIKRAFNVIHADLAKTLEPFGLRMISFSALGMIVENPHLRQYQLADALEIERPNLVVIVDELEGRGLIERKRVKTDRRAYALVPTKEGKALFKSVSEAVQAHEAYLFRNFQTGDDAELLRILNSIENQGVRK